MDNTHKHELLREALFDPNRSQNDREMARRALERISLEGSDLERNQANRILFEHGIASASPITKEILKIAGTDPLADGFWQKVYQFFAEKQVAKDIQEQVLRELTGNPDLAKLLAAES